MKIYVKAELLSGRERNGYFVIPSDMSWQEILDNKTTFGSPVSFARIVSDAMYDPDFAIICRFDNYDDIDSFKENFPWLKPTGNPPDENFVELLSTAGFKREWQEKQGMYSQHFKEGDIVQVKDNSNAIGRVDEVIKPLDDYIEYRLVDVNTGEFLGNFSDNELKNYNLRPR